MTAHSVVFVFLVCAVAALAFEVGRESETTLKPAQPPPLVAVENPKPPTTQIHTQPINVVDIARLPFAEVYAGIKAATPEELKVWIERMQLIKPTPTRWTTISSFFKTLIQIDAKTAIAFVGNLGKGDRWAALMAVRDAAPPRATEQIVSLIRTFPAEETSDCNFDYLRDAFAEWSAFDPVAASTYFDQHSKDEKLQRYVATVVENWAAYDPESAQKWAKRMLEQESSETINGSEWPYPLAEMTEAWVKGYLRHDRSSALDYVIKFQNQPGVKQAIPLVANALFCDSPKEAMAFLQRLPAERQAEALGGIAWATDRKVYHDADDWKRSPEFVANWILQFPTEAWRDPMERVMTEWRYGDKPGLFAWMSQLPADTRDKVAAQYHPYLPPDIAEKEFDLVMHVSDTSLRDHLLENFMAASQDSKETTLRFLAGAQLSETQKQHLASLIPKREYEIYHSPDDDESDDQE